jgi:hypothetical protein
MPQALVDVLEAVEVDVQDGERGALPPAAPGEGYPEAVLEKGAVGEVGQGIMEGVVEVLFLERLGFGDVDPVGGDLAGPPPVGRNGQAELVAEPAIPSVPVPYPEVVDEVPDLADVLNMASTSSRSSGWTASTETRLLQNSSGSYPRTVFTLLPRSGPMIGGRPEAQDDPELALRDGQTGLGGLGLRSARGPAPGRRSPGRPTPRSRTSGGPPPRREHSASSLFQAFASLSI